MPDSFHTALAQAEDQPERFSPYSFEGKLYLMKELAGATHDRRDPTRRRLARMMMAVQAAPLVAVIAGSLVALLVELLRKAL